MPNQSNFIFGSFNSASQTWCYKLKPINFPTPEKDTVSYEVPGRSGDLLIDFGSYKNVELECEVCLEAGSGETFLTCYDKLRSTIMVQNGYQRLEDSLYPGEYRMARAVGIERSKSDTKNGTAVITFDAKPQRYLTSGESVALTVTQGTSSSVVTYGVAGNILHADFIASFISDPTAEYAVVDLGDINGTPYELKAYYTAQAPEPVRCQVASGDVTVNGGGQGSYAPVQDGWWYRQDSGLTIDDHDHISTGYQAVFPIDCLLRWEVYDSTNHLLASSSNGGGTITPTSGVMDFAPLIDIEVPGAMSSRAAVLGDYGIITLNTPATINGETITDVMIDCETLNVYTVINNVTYNLNPYATLEGEFILPGNASTDIDIEGGVISLKLTPRWWKL